MSQVDSNPFINTDTNKRYYTYDFFLRKTFGEKCAKITLDIGCTCPNIDGKCGFGGCIYCHDGSMSLNTKPLLSVEEQYYSQINEIKKKWPKVTKFIPYFQSHTNTYTSLEKIKDYLEKAMKLDGAVMINIATRADCLEDEKIELIDKYAEQIPVTIELGLQTSNDKTAGLINRGHSYETFVDCFERIRKKSDKIKIAIHIINGLPGESKVEMMETAKEIARLNPDILKIHLLHIIKGTAIEKQYLKNEYSPLSLEDYVDIVCSQIEILPPNLVIERVGGDVQLDLLVAPMWCSKKVSVINEIDKELFKRNTYQGKNYIR